MDSLLQRLLFILFFSLLLDKINDFFSPLFPHRPHQTNKKSCCLRKLNHEIHLSYSL